MDGKQVRAAMDKAAENTIKGVALGIRGEEGSYDVVEKCVVEARVTVRYPDEIDGREWLREDGDMRHAWEHMHNRADGAAADLGLEIQFLKRVAGSGIDEKVRDHLERHLLMACHVAERLDELAGKIGDSSHEHYADGVVKLKADYIIPSVEEK